MEILCTRLPSGALAPVDAEQAERLKHIKAGATVRCEIAQVRNPAFHRKWFALAKFAYDIWTDTMPEREYRGQPVRPNFDRFRKELTILAGFGEPVWNINGDMRMEAKSLSFGSMSEDEFQRCYSALIDVILHKVLSGTKLTEADLRAHADRVLQFS